MKKLSFLIMVVAMLFLSTGNANAQSKMESEKAIEEVKNYLGE